MKTIQLTQGKVAIIDDEDYEKVCTKKWYAHKRTGKYYAESGGINGRYMLHIFVMGLENGVLLDHKDGDSLNNQKENLRVCTRQQNSYNKKPYSTAPIAGIKGISLNKKSKRWRAQIQKDKKKIYIGVYSNYLDAAKAYNEKAIELFGEFSQLNKI